MAHHFMAVCMFCLLCADHFPCKGHLIDGSAAVGFSAKQFLRDDRALFLNSQDDLHNDHHLHQPLPQYDSNVVVKRVKRHHSHVTHDVHEIDQRRLSENKNSQKFLEQIFNNYGDSDSKTMTLDDFKRMLATLGMKTLLQSGRSVESNNNCKADSYSLVTMMSPNPPLAKHEHEQHSQHDSEEAAHDRYHHPNELEHGHNKKSKHQEHEDHSLNITINAEMMWNICPILLYQLTSQSQLERDGCIQTELVSSVAHSQHSVVSSDEHEQERGLVWIYSTIAVLGVSLCGLLGVAVIPCMDKHFYHHTLQFFVALAVGTLCGDALLHLMPHSMIAATTMSHDDAHAYMMWKGLTAVSGVVFFYFIERALTIIAGRWAQSKKTEKPSKKLNVIHDPESNVSHHVAPRDKQCMHKYSSSPYCYNEIAMESREGHKVAEEEKKKHHMNHLNHNSSVYKSFPNHSEQGDHAHNDSEQRLLDGHNNYNISDNYKNLCNSFSKDPGDETTVSTCADTSPIESAKVPLQSELENGTRTIILREHQTKHHGHSHTHGHVHSPPESLSAVAWMVIMGDGLHNFTDGMAIGAAFSNNIAGGFSTAIAVFCHELPHELGDFAVLLKAGMSAKQAVFYNILSSVLSFFGMVAGVILGDTPEASAWIFACAAGMFLYIALVDMIPELTSSHGKEERCQFSESILQFVGMSLGFGIMLLISLYEHDLKQVFDNTRLTSMNGESNGSASFHDHQH